MEAPGRGATRAGQGRAGRRYKITDPDSIRRAGAPPRTDPRAWQRRWVPAVALLCWAALAPPTQARSVPVGDIHLPGHPYPWNAGVDYAKWAASNTLYTNDVAVFRYKPASDGVYLMASARAFEKCDFKGAKALCPVGAKAPGPVECKVAVAASPKYIASSREHCKQGQKVVIQGRRKGLPALMHLLGNAGSITLHVKAAAPAPAKGPIVVGGLPSGLDSPGHYFNPLVDYAKWMKDTTIREGDSIAFKYPKYSELVYQFADEQAWASCNYAAATLVCSDTQGVGEGCVMSITAGTWYLASGIWPHCQGGQKIKFTVAQKKVYAPRNVVVGYPAGGLSWPWNPMASYSHWMKATDLYVGDTLVFVYPAHKDEVYMVPTLADFHNCNYENYISYCNETDGTQGGCYSNPLKAGMSYFVSGWLDHCQAGQKVAVRAMTPP